MVISRERLGKVIPVVGAVNASVSVEAVSAAGSSREDRGETPVVSV
jgi:hypothetical protein